jgi:putative flippase GtrA
LHFDFAPRHEGQSKADLNEGMRFFRHLTRLRLTVNQHLIRFLTLVVLAVAGNLALLAALATGAGWPLLRAAAVAGGVTIAGILVGEAWVFSDRPRGPTRRRLLAVLLLGLVFLGAVYLPAIWLLAVRLGAPYLLAALAAMLLAGFVYYGISEQWIWTRGLMMRPRASTYYDIHGIVALASQVPLDDLSHFQTAAPPARIDLQLRVDRHGTPSRVPGAICYDEHLGRFGFGLTVIPGDFTEIVVSPQLETSPAFLYTNVVEPVLRWQLVTRGYVLPRAGGVVELTEAGGRAVLIAGPPDMGYGLGRLCAGGRLAFLGDDRVLLGRDRRARRFPKPITARREMLPGGGAARATLALALQRLLYSRPVRRLGLWLSDRRLPAATLNTYLQRLIPQPKRAPHDLVPGLVYGEATAPGLLLLPERDGALPPLAQLLDEGEAAFGFQPYPLLLAELARWGGRDWAAEERAILSAALAGCERVAWRPGERWWEQVESAVGAGAGHRAGSSSLAMTAV